MDYCNRKGWASQPDVCRCCLAATGIWDLTASYINDAGEKEVFSDIVRDCFGITLSHLTDLECSKMVCALCVGRLQNAHAFYKIVFDAERLFLEHWRDVISLSAKFEDDELQTNQLEDSSDCTYDSNREQSVVNFINCDKNVNSKKIKSRQGRQKKMKKKKQRKAVEEDIVDKTLTQFSHTYDESSESITGNIQEKSQTNDEKDQNVQIFFKEPHPNQDIKQVSERKRVILTCGIVLKDTTACPFRHHKSWFQCFYCSEDFMEINMLRNHILQLHSNIEEELKNIKRYPRSLQIDISELKCRHCDVTLTDVEAMTRHFEFSHQKVIYKECIADYKVDVSPYTCHLCKREFHVFRTLTTHLNEHYANCICDVCGKSFLNSKRLKVHKRTHENGTYPCNECGKVLKTKTSKANHMESVHSKRIVKCQICFKPMKHYNDRIKHMSEVHNITHSFKCSICSREYNIKHYLATHMRQTHGHKNKKCLECGMAFITNHGLKKHMLRHSGEKPYSCAVCSKSYVRSSTLRVHMRVHEGEKV